MTKKSRVAENVLRYLEHKRRAVTAKKSRVAENVLRYFPLGWEWIRDIEEGRDKSDLRYGNLYSSRDLKGRVLKDLHVIDSEIRLVFDDGTAVLKLSHSDDDIVGNRVWDLTDERDPTEINELIGLEIRIAWPGGEAFEFIDNTVITEGGISMWGIDREFSRGAVVEFQTLRQGRKFCYGNQVMFIWLSND